MVTSLCRPLLDHDFRGLARAFLLTRKEVKQLTLGKENEGIPIGCGMGWPEAKDKGRVTKEGRQRHYRVFHGFGMVKSQTLDNYRGVIRELREED